MSWYRQIKVIYTICSNTFFFILWATVLNGFFGGKIDYKLYLISLLTSFLYVYIFEKKEDTKLAVSISFVVSEALLFLLYGSTSFLMNSIYICFLLFISNADEGENINYELYKYKAKQAIAVLVVLGFIFTFTKLSLQQEILKFYIIFLITVSILMRETRNYYYRIRNKKSFIANLGLAVGILFISLDKVFNLVVIAFKFFVGIFYKITDVLINFIVGLMQKPMEVMINFLGKKFANKSDSLSKIKGFNDNMNIGKESLNNTPTKGLPNWMSASLRIVLLLVIIYFAYKLVTKFKDRRSMKDEEIIEERIKISKERTIKDNFIKKTLTNLLRISELKDQAINVYKKFQAKTNEKGIFKTHMTAKQLENVTKAYINNPQGIDNLTKIYNEAKFSNHKISKEQLETIKDSFNKIKKQL